MYKDIAKNLDLFEIKYPKTLIPNPTDEDYSKSYILRFFTRKSNDQYGHIFEIDQDTFGEYLENPFWTSVSIKWRISGPLYTTYNDNGTMKDRGVIESNKASIGIGSQKLKNLKLYLPNLLQFYKG